MPASRREFLRRSGCAALSASAFASSLTRFGLVDALAQHHHHAVAPLATDYRALVCVFLAGGNDAWNTIVNLDDYASYATTRASIALAQGTLLPIDPPERQPDLRPARQPVRTARAVRAAEARRRLQRGHADRADHRARSTWPVPRCVRRTCSRTPTRCTSGRPGSPLPPHDGLGRARRRPHVDHERSRPLPHDRDAGGRHRLRNGAVARAFEMTPQGTVALSGFSSSDELADPPHGDARPPRHEPRHHLRTHGGRHRRQGARHGCAGHPGPEHGAAAADGLPRRLAGRPARDGRAAHLGARPAGHAPPDLLRVSSAASTPTAARSPSRTACSPSSARPRAPSTRRPWRWASRTRSRPSPPPTSGAPTARTAPAPTTAGAAASSSWAARCAAATSSATGPRSPSEGPTTPGTTGASSRRCRWTSTRRRSPLVRAAGRRLSAVFPNIGALRQRRPGLFV